MFERIMNVSIHLNQDTNLRKIKSHDNFAGLTTTGGGTKPLADLEKRKKGKLYPSDVSFIRGKVRKIAIWE